MGAPLRRLRPFSPCTLPVSKVQLGESLVSQSSLPCALAKYSSKLGWPAVFFWLVLGPFAFLISPLKLESSLADPGGVTDATSCFACSSFSLVAGLLAFHCPLTLLAVLVAEKGELASWEDLVGWVMPTGGVGTSAGAVCCDD